MHKRRTGEERAASGDQCGCALCQVQGVLDMVRGIIEDLYKMFVPESQRSSFEQVYKKHKKNVLERIPKLPTPVRTPDIDILDLGTEIHLTADLPGVKKDDIEIDLMPESIEISAESKTEMEREQQPYARRERGYMAYKRKLDLPAEVVPSKAKARFNNGVLEVTIPRKEPAQKVEPTRVEIKDTDQLK